MFMEYVMKAITARRSVRSFRQRTVPQDKVEKLLEAAAAAPSGKNSQPWCFAAIDEQQMIFDLASLMRRSRFIELASLVIAVYKCESRCYAEAKDNMAIGAAIENMLLCAEEAGLAACWVCENIEDAERYLAKRFRTNGCILMSLVAIGYRDNSLSEERRPAPRKRPAELLEKRRAWDEL